MSASSAVNHKPGHRALGHSDLQVEGHRVAVVTGASSGIGRASAIALAKAGFEVWAGARRTEKMVELGDHGIRILGLDVTDDASMQHFVDAVLAGAGRIDVLVNNAGFGLYGSVEDVPVQTGRELFDVNLFGLARMVQLVLPTMRAQKKNDFPALRPVFSLMPPA